ncbi:hypothetical protein U0070_021260 [Myodes glareolus]|uniref:G-protein coupled receptors family 1 profile domain-containing protein n=1 Tax=Myodes glareolus TaxID=447135 RepID=A0AAW0H4D5_MYOGA
MTVINKSHPEEFILLGFADRPWLELPLFIILLVTYPLAMLGNIAIILVFILDPHLHSPMYFFLTNLSFLDMCYITSIVPQMLTNLGGSTKTISYMRCVVQLYFFHTMAATECVLLALMSFDRYVAICKPLHYSLIMNQCTCLLLVSTVWLTGIIYAVSEVTMTLQLPLCGHNKLDHLMSWWYEEVMISGSGTSVHFSFGVINGCDVIRAGIPLLYTLNRMFWKPSHLILIL